MECLIGVLLLVLFTFVMVFLINYVPRRFREDYSKPKKVRLCYKKTEKGLVYYVQCKFSFFENWKDVCINSTELNPVDLLAYWFTAPEFVARWCYTTDAALARKAYRVIRDYMQSLNPVPDIVYVMDEYPDKFDD